MRRTILALALMASAAPAMAQMPDTPPPPPGGPMHGGPGMGGAMLMRTDTNRDGVITRDEAAALADLHFARLDADGDGKVTRGEMRAARDSMREGRDERRTAMRDRALADGKTPPPPPPPGDRARPGPDRGPGPKAGPDRGPRQPMTREASRAHAMAAFDRADANRDGRIDTAEIAQMRGKWRERGPRGDMPPPPPPVPQQ